MAMTKDRSGRRPWGGLEDEVLAALWAASGPVTATAVQTELGGDLAYGTITTILGRLRAKGLVIRTQIGRTYEYTPAQDAASHTASRMHSLLVSRGDRAEVLARFVSELSAEEERLLHAVLRDITQDDLVHDGLTTDGLTTDGLTKDGLTQDGKADHGNAHDHDEHSAADTAEPAGR